MLLAVTLAYLAWSLLPVLIAVLFSFNAGRSRTTWQGFSLRWYVGDPLRSVWHDAGLHRRAHPPCWACWSRPSRCRSASRWRWAWTAGAAASPRARTSPCSSRSSPRDPGRGVPALRGHRAHHAPAAGHERPGDRAGHLPARLPRGHRAQPAPDDRPRLRGGRHRPGRLAERRRTPGAAQDAAPRHLRQCRPGVRGRDRRLRHRPLPVGRLLDRAGVGEGLQHRPGRADACAERADHAPPARVAARGGARVPGLPVVHPGRAAAQEPRRVRRARPRLERPFNRKAARPSPATSRPRPSTPTRWRGRCCPSGPAGCCRGRRTSTPRCWPGSASTSSAAGCASAGPPTWSRRPGRGVRGGVRRAPHRDRDGVLRGFENACRHRGHELLPCGGSAQARRSCARTTPGPTGSTAA